MVVGGAPRPRNLIHVCTLCTLQRVFNIPLALLL